MLFFFHHFYHSFAWTYDLVAAAVSLGRWQAWGRAALPHLSGIRIIELGFGPGHLQAELNRQGFHPIGLDESPQMIRLASRNLAREKFPARLARGVAQTLPFASSSIDSVLAVFPTEYIADELTLSEVHRVLKAGGRLVVVPMAWSVRKSFADALTDWLFRITGQREPLAGGFSERIRFRLAAAGFRVKVLGEEQFQSVVLVIVAEK